jgi:hypothetical protein
MSLSQVHYLPHAPPFFFILVGLFVALLVLIALRLYASRDQLRCGAAPAARLSHRQLFQHFGRLSAGAIGIVRTGNRFLRNALRRSIGQPVAPNSGCGECRRRGDSHHDVRLPARQESVVGKRAVGHGRSSGDLFLAISPSARSRHSGACNCSSGDNGDRRIAPFARTGSAARLHRRQSWDADRCGSPQSRQHPRAGCSGGLDRRSWNFRRYIPDWDRRSADCQPFEVME